MDPSSLRKQKTHKIIPHNVYALVDSGADNCLCSETIAIFLGEMVPDKKKRTIKKFTAADGKQFEGYKVSLNIFVCGHDYTCDFYVTNSLPHFCPLVLGQHGFFSEHKVMFDFQKKKIAITPY